MKVFILPYDLALKNVNTLFFHIVSKVEVFIGLVKKNVEKCLNILCYITIAAVFVTFIQPNKKCYFRVELTIGQTRHSSEGLRGKSGL